MKVTLVQAQPAIGDVKANLATILDHVARASGDLVAFPELFLAGYMSRDAHRTLAEPLDGPSVRAVADAARRHGKTVVFGMPRRSEVRGVVHNSAVLVRPDGTVGAYDKVYLPSFSVFEEDLYFGEGAALPVFETPVGKVGLCICYDLFFPEVTKVLAMKGAEILLCISASPSISKTYFEAVLPARAIETTCWTFFVNNVGPQDNLVFWGGSQGYSPRGIPLGRAPDMEPATLDLALDPAELELARTRRPVLRDTRPSIWRWFADEASRTRP
ncbi:MAG: carbon-nitrogen hydrolase family protein [Methanobacteriota archaeon]